MTTTIHHLGQKGVTGQDAQDGTGINEVSFKKTKSALADAIKPSGYESQLITDRDGYASFLNNLGEIDENPGDNIVYCLNYSNGFDNTSGWTPFLNGYTVNSTSKPDPFGGFNAYEISYPDTSADGAISMVANIDSDFGKVHRFSLWVKLVSGNLDYIEVNGRFTTDNAVRIYGVTSEWQRLSVVLSTSSIANTLIFTPKGTGCVLDVYEMQVTQGAGLYPIKRTTDNTPLLVENTAGAGRNSRDGVIKEKAKENLCIHSHDLQRWDTAGFVSIGYNTNDGGIFYNSRTLVEIDGTSNVTISRSDIDIVQGETYTVSFYTRLVSGTINSATVAIGQSPSEFEPSSKLERLSFTLVAGQNGRIAFSITPDTEECALVIAGVQIEQGDLSSYIAASDRENQRGIDLISYDVEKISRIDKPFTFNLAFRNYKPTGGEDFLFNIGGQFFVKVENGNISLNNGDESAFSLSDGDVTIAYDGSGTAKLYVDSAEVASESVTITDIKPDYFYIGASDDVGSNGAEFDIKQLKWWDSELNQDEIQNVRAN